MHPRLMLRALLLIWGSLILYVSSASAQVPGLELDRAEQVNFEQDGQVVTASGNVVLRKGDRLLQADTVTYNIRTEEAVARGSVVFVNGDQVWKGEELRYNFLTEEGSFPDLELRVGLFQVQAGESDKLGPVQTQMRDVTVTTCEDLEKPDFAIRSGKVDVYEESIVVLRHPVFRLHGFPFFYLPKLTLDQEREPTNVDVEPGYSSRDGFILKTALNVYPAPGFRTKTHLDYRTNRGVAFGQDLIWYDEDKEGDHTRFESYFALDDRPYKNEEEEDALRAQGVDLDQERYRVNFFSRRNFSANDSLFLKAAYWSDSRITRDFFEEEYRREPVPETRATYTARGEIWTADIELSKQLNQAEFESVNRLPEATFSIPRVRVGDLNLLYESESRAGFLERGYSDLQRESGEEDYETLRLHTEHMVFYPTRQLGWLNVVPRAGLSVTSYEETLETVTEVRPVSSVDENNIITTSLETNTLDVVRSGKVRVVPELGFETSFKAFGLVHDRATSLGKGLRHVVEPFTNYTWQPEPDPKPENLYQFDRIDRLDEQHQLAFGVRNKWQTKQRLANGGHRVRDMVNLNLTSLYDLRSEADPSLGDMVADLELDVVEWLTLRTEARYDTDVGELEDMLTEVEFVAPVSKNSLRINQRFRQDRDHTLQVAYDLNPKGKVGLRGYTRYELEEEGFEEQQLLLRIEGECVGYGFGGKWIQGDVFADGTQEDDKYEVWFQFWLTAFPRSVLSTGGDDV
jgi:lipopolysaccharide assembly outer membrane protein LptD (OstA)